MIDTVIDRAQAYIKGARKPITQELKLLKKLMYETIKARNGFYSKGIIYGKYRNYIAVSTFCDYFISGRCSELGGSNGAYNLFESEIRSDIIISQLDKVVDHLQSIRSTQYYLYKQLELTNKLLVDMDYQLIYNNYTLNSIMEIAAEAEQYNAVAAFYAKKNTELTSAVAILTALT